mmetsp:Transcript_104405/g.196550  ORF Transcript_104405/g.196550 Transcript_104405/m.196550 type:complete len:507 (-) Transcript_104405:167-1687(-)
MATFGWLWGANDAAENQEIEHTSGAERLFNNILCAMCGTPCLLLIAMILLGWNEKRFVCDQNAIVTGQDVTKEVGCDSATAGDGELVLFSCDLKTTGLTQYTNLGDFNTALSAYRGTGLDIDAEMLQCVENVASQTKKDNVGGGTTTIKTYTYTTEWRSQRVDSNAFHKKNSGSFNQNCNSENPQWPSGVPQSQKIYKDTAKVGAFSISKTFVEEIALTAPVQGTNSATGWTLSGTTYSSDKHKVFGNVHNIGSMRVNFKGTDWSNPKHTVLGENKKGTIGKWTAPDSWLCSGYTLSKVRAGTVDIDTLFKDMADANQGVTWVIRFLGFLLAWCAFSLLAGPLEVIADCIPCIGPFLGDSIAAIACCVSCPPGCACAMVVIAIVWVAMRPAVGGALIVVFLCTMCAFVGFKAYSKNAKVDSEATHLSSEPIGAGEGGAAPVAAGTARGFLDALRAEYVNGEEGACGAFLDAQSGEVQDKLNPFEEQVQNAGDKDEAINNIANKWGL